MIFRPLLRLGVPGLFLFVLAVGCKPKPSNTQDSSAPAPTATVSEAGKGGAKPLADLLAKVPEELRQGYKTSKEKRKNINDWLEANINGKGKSVLLQVYGESEAPEASANGKYTAKFSAFSKTVDLFGDKQKFIIHDGSVTEKKGPFEIEAFVFNDLKKKEAEWITGLKETVVEGTVKKMEFLPDPADGAILFITLDDVKFEGKPFKHTPR